MEPYPHAVCIPYPSQGHVTPFMQLAKLLHSKGFHITFVNTEFNHRRLLRSQGPDSLNGYEGFQFETITDGLPSSDRDATQDVTQVCDSTSKNCLAPLIDLIKKLNSSKEIPQVSCIIFDGVMTWGIKAAEALGVPGVAFWTASACGFMGFLQYPELINRSLVPLKDENCLVNGNIDTILDWVPGMKNIRLKDIPRFNRTIDPEDFMLKFLGQQAQNCLKASTIIFNTFDDLEQEVLGAISSIFPHNIYTIGVLAMLGRDLPDSQLKSMRSSLWKEDSNCLSWLDKVQPNSVIYVNFGSITVMTDQQLKEFAWGLANSKYSFLWIIRPDVVMGESAILPKEFVEEIKDRALLASWCPQDEVLSHPSIAGFLTHCGWNSMLESLCNGVPVICWPFFAEQPTNCRYACTEDWGTGLEITNNVKREEIEELVKELMVGDHKGKKMKENVLNWKAKAKEATKQGGTSYNNFDKFIKVLHPI